MNKIPNNITKVGPTFPTKIEELPNEEFYAILFPTTVTIPGDERSRTNPGHGYPEHTSSYWNIQLYVTREVWEAEIIRLEAQKGYMRPAFKAVKMTPAQVKISVSIENL